jgi:hypothetical protein
LPAACISTVSRSASSAWPSRIVAALEDVPQDDVRQLLDEKRRDVDLALEQSHVEGFDGPCLHQAVPEAQDDLVVVARIRVFDGKKIFFGDALPGGFHQAGVKGPLAVARLLDRMDFRPQVVGAQEIVGDPKPSGRVAL